MDMYDKIIAGALTSLTLGAVISFIVGIPVNIGAAAGAILSFGFIYNGVFKNSPSKLA